MMKRMLINATQAEELRVAVVDGQKLLELEIEFPLRPEKKSNIYKGIITRIEPSLDAVFVDYGDERHGFLPFKDVSARYFKEGLDPHRCRVGDALREGQPLIVQVEKDERGNKGAALSTYIALAGRYVVLMPANPRAAGVSRRADANSRHEMREILDQLPVPKDMGLIIRTAGIGRDIEDILWDFDYLKQLWQAIVDATKRQQEPGLIYQESNLIIRAIRDYFQQDVHEILVDTQEIYDQAFGFMSYVMPHFSHRIKLYNDDTPLFSRFQIEQQIETAYARQVNLPSGGSIVIDRTEALVAIDINSSRSTRGQDIEHTALTNNLEAAEEIARQLRLRDLGGLIVIDFIDMESQPNQRKVENKIREALRYDRARVQMQRLSRFGLMELSRQRLHPALGESSNVICPRCGGEGSLRSNDSFALQALREIEDEALKENSGEVRIQLPVEVATFLLNEKRNDIHRIELHNRVNIVIIPNKYLESPNYRITRLRHDELNTTDNEKQSYQWAEELKPEEEADYRQSNPTIKQQTPVVKSFRPTNRAPIRPAKQDQNKTTFWTKLKKWFFEDDSLEVKNTPIKKHPPTASEKSSRKPNHHSPHRTRYHERHDNAQQRNTSKETPYSRGNRQNNKEEPRREHNPREGRKNQDRPEKRFDSSKPSGYNPTEAKNDRGVPKNKNNLPSSKSDSSTIQHSRENRNAHDDNGPSTKRQQEKAMNGSSVSTTSRHSRNLRAKQFGLEHQTPPQKTTYTTPKESKTPPTSDRDDNHSSIYSHLPTESTTNTLKEPVSPIVENIPPSPPHNTDNTPQEKPPMIEKTAHERDDSSKERSPIIEKHTDTDQAVSNTEKLSVDDTQTNTFDGDKTQLLPERPPYEQSLPEHHPQESTHKVPLNLEVTLPSHLKMVETTSPLPNTNTLDTHNAQLGRALDDALSPPPNTPLKQVETQDHDNSKNNPQ